MAKISERKPNDCAHPPDPKLTLSLSIPLRMSNWISFKRPVTKITSHLGNEVRSDYWEENLEKPQQLCWQNRLQGVQAYGSVGDLLSTLDLVKALQKHMRGGTAGVHTKQASSSPCMEMGPAKAGLHVPPFLCKEFLVTEEDIKTQEKKVKAARERLALALLVDRLASEAEMQKRLRKEK
ncbi:methyl-CpG-binding domain protein 3-like 1 [Perognathus longimembris pacificus]|uniref:methyl-CpG-binding domain protein 3-like 1 n=1 Tax=Perognathus longimembris pacificus TaxID=214514 RepID=UPI002019626D|nr:methyl-CpG-binding domain protein 3-like 1 [Perognathus longimembris pacificus]